MKLQKGLFSATLAFLIAAPFAAHASQEKIDFDRATGSSAFHAVGRPSAIKINGTGASPKGVLTWGDDGRVGGSVTLDLSSLDTGISMRTNHMKEKYLEAGKFPQAKLAITELGIPATNVSKEFTQENASFKGNLTLHGVTKPVSGTLRIEHHAKNAVVHAEFTVKISDYSIAIPVFAGITVADEVNIAVDANAPVSLVAASK
ncbi:MAG: YceI family protein [Oligoflexia bacterium]|nr:YceI family protein [Oligoflexia bacterium]